MRPRAELMNSAALPPSARHIVTYAQSLRGGGVERAMLRLARAWIEQGRRVTLLLGSAEGPLRAELPGGLHIVPLGSDNFGVLLRDVPGHVRRLAPDIVFCPGNHYTSVASLTRARLGRRGPPVVAKVSNTLRRPDQRFPIRQGNTVWLRLQPQFIDHVVAMTPAMAEETRALMGVSANRVSVIPNPPARPIPGAVMPALPPGRFLLGVGRLAVQKRWERLIAAMADIADPSVALVILGEGSERAPLEAQIGTLGLGGRVFLPGHAADPLPAIDRAEAVVLVSDFEGVPGVLREALAHGTPVVTTASTVAADEIVTSPDQGSIVPTGDPVALARALDHWLAPGRARPAPVAQPGEHAAEAYLALFDRLVAKPV